MVIIKAPILLFEVLLPGSGLGLSPLIGLYIIGHRDLSRHKSPYWTLNPKPYISPKP